MTGADVDDAVVGTDYATSFGFAGSKGRGPVFGHSVSIGDDPIHAVEAGVGFGVPMPWADVGGGFEWSTGMHETFKGFHIPR